MNNPVLKTSGEDSNIMETISCLWKPLSRSLYKFVIVPAGFLTCFSLSVFPSMQAGQ